MDPTLGLVLMLSLSALLIGAGIHKLRNIAWFDELFLQYRLLPSRTRQLKLQRVLPYLEIAVGASLLVADLRPYAAMAAAVLLLTYASAIAINLRRGRRDLECGCGAYDHARPIAQWMVWRNVGIAMLASVGVVSWSDRPLQLIDCVTIGCGCVVIALLYRSFERLVGDIAGRSLHWGDRS
jgi:Methylamine utilisation protein MauE